ncbi:MAG TPA: zf-HC2 domain-containing protein [Thermoanaerobaculia bacterium]|nr:zf-HC2 domain-containing protein [Thermoanaerobaculia bacterium]
MVTTETCPSLEEVAAFLDGTLPEEERARLTRHLADCDSCYELFAGAARSLLDTAAAELDEEADRPPAVVVPPAWQLPRRTAWVPWSAGLSVAALLLFALAAVIGISTYRWWTSTPVLQTASLVRPLGGVRTVLTEKLYKGAVLRGGKAPETPPEDAKAFQLGVELADLRVTVQAREKTKFAEVMRDIARMISNVDLLGGEDSKNYFSLADKVQNDPAAFTPTQLGKEADDVEKNLDTRFGIHLSFGKWTEAARLAALAKEPSFCRTWTSRRFLHRLRAQQDEPIEGEILERLGKVETTLARRPLRRADFAAAATELKEIIDHYDRLAGESADPAR